MIDSCLQISSHLSSFIILPPTFLHAMKLRKVIFLIITSNLIYLTLHLTAPDHYAEVLASGIMFHEESKILLAEKFSNIEFLVPFPKYTFEVKTRIVKRLQTLADMWATPTIFCPMDELRPFNASSKPVNVNWLCTKLLAELQAAKNDVFEMGNETATLLTMEERQRRGLPAAAVVSAGIGVLGSGILMGNQCSGITGIFGSCQDTGRQNAENTDRLQQHASAFTDFAMEVAQEHDEKFFLI